MSDQLSRLGLSFQRLSAVDGQKIDIAAFAEIPLSPGEIGCFLSHRSAWTRLVQSDRSHAIILEDDAHLSPDLADIITDLSWFPSDAMIVKLETMAMPVLLDPKEHNGPGQRKLKRLRSAHPGTAGYIISRSGATALLRKSESFNQPVDDFMFSKRALTYFPTYQMLPAAIIQHQFRCCSSGKLFEPSEIVPERRKRKFAQTRPPLARLILRELWRAVEKLRYKTLPRVKYGDRFQLVSFQ